jgi:hypothetical protein
MRDHFSIRLAGDFEANLGKILDHAREDPRIVYWDRGQWGHALVFCFTPQMAQREKESIARSGVTRPSLCLLEIHPSFQAVLVNQECMDQPRSILAEFVKWILANFTCDVRDEDTRENLSDLASKRPDELFQ